MTTKKSRYLTAAEAADLLGVSKPTLYAYVSRGLIRSEDVGEGRRTSRYLAEDVYTLAERKAQRRDPSRAARSALDWGQPVLDSALTLIADETLYYRGQNVARLARERSFEQVAALLWLDDMEQAGELFGMPSTPGGHGSALSLQPYVETVAGLGLPLMGAMQTALALAAADDLSAYDLAPSAVAATGARILHLLTGVVCRGEPAVRPYGTENGLAGQLAAAWGVAGERRLIEATLILCADHELNASSFAARVAASAGANPYAVVTAGLAALQGYKHGGNTERVAAFLREIETPENARAVIAERLRRGERLPGFGHRLYAEHDPRAVVLLDLLAEYRPESPALALAEAVEREARAVISRPPNVDFALVTLERALGLPRGAALALFGLGRTAGWIAHAIEQYADDRLLRPRARYTGRGV